jgi:hypothetical protein
LRRDEAHHLPVVESHAAVAEELPTQHNSKRGKGFGPAGIVQGLAIGQHSIEIEKNGVELGHGGEIPAYHVVSLRTEAMPNEEALQAEIERLRAENEALKKPVRGQLSLRVSAKGALSVYGLGRFPVTLYREQWEKLLAMTDQIRKFIDENDAELKRKE